MTTGGSWAIPAGAGTTCCPISGGPRIIAAAKARLHGAGGEWRVERQRLTWDILRAVQEGAKEFGILPRDDFNDGSNEGSGFFEVNQSRGLRWNTARGFLRPALRRGNLRVVTHALVRRITLEGRRATGVEWLADNAPFRASAGAEVILAAGAINSPKLLELSGIGQPDRMAALGIAVAHDLPGVGENLQDHLQIRTVFKVRGTPDPERHGRQPARQGADRAAICADPQRTDVDGSQPVRHVHEIGPRPRDARP